METLAGIVTSNRLSSGYVASLVGILMFACIAFVGFYGNSMRRAIRRRSYERRGNMNPQLPATSDWWIRQLRLAPPRPVLWNVLNRRIVVTYSGGEGAGAGVGVAIWASCFAPPQAGRLLVPDVVRKAWSSSRRQPADPFYYVQVIEGVGPLIAFTNSKDALRDALWLHFIDNNGAFSCLVKGG